VHGISAFGVGTPSTQSSRNIRHSLIRLVAIASSLHRTIAIAAVSCSPANTMMPSPAAVMAERDRTAGNPSFCGIPPASCSGDREKSPTFRGFARLVRDGRMIACNLS
jgi:hypothetical protein